MAAGQDDARLGSHNRRLVLDLVRRNGPLTRAAVRTATGLTPQTVSNITARLLADGLVREAPATPGTRTPRALTLAPDGRSAVGVHIDPAQVTVVLLDLAGGLVTARHLGAADPLDPAATLDRIADAVEDVLTTSGVDRRRVSGIGVATPGPLDAEPPAATVLGAPAQLTGWAGIPIAAALATRTGLPVHVEKDAVADALAEWWTATSTEDLVAVYLGHGVSAGIVLDGRVVRGGTGNAGEFGGMPVHAHGGWTALWQACQPFQQVRRGIAAGLLPGVPSPDPEDPAAVRAAFERLCAGPAAHDLVAQAGTALGSALAHVVELLDLPRVVVGGSAALAGGATFLDAVRARLAERLPLAVPAVAFTTLGEDVVARGAACAVLATAAASAGPVPPALLADRVPSTRSGGSSRRRDIAHPW